MFQRLDADSFLPLSATNEVDVAVDLREKSMVASHSDVESRKKHTASLTHEDVSGLNELASGSLHA